jgi:CheY-like chemotaxis protein
MNLANPNSEIKSEPVQRALVVDDDDLSREFVAIVLGRAGYEVQEAPDGLTALDMCRTTNFEVVICDILMPRLNGLSFIRNLANMSPNSVKRVFFVSGLDDRSIRQEALDAGAEAFLVKPLNSKALIELLRGPQSDSQSGTQS